MKKHWTTIVPGAVLMACLGASPASAVDFRTAVQQALQTNPEIHQAIYNKDATRHERQQAEGLYYPRISVETSAGVRELRNPTRRSIGIAEDTLYPLEAMVMVDQLLFDSGAREAEIRYQAARTDAAAARVEERSEFIALNTARAYIDYILQQRIVAISMDNSAFHQRLVGDLREGVQQGSISIADQQQAEERLQSAQARVVEAQEDMDAAAITFQKLTGMPIGDVSMPPDLSGALPESLAAAELLARQNNPLVDEAVADLEAARQLVKKAKGEMGPRFNLEGKARYGRDIDGFEGKTTDYLGRFVMRWTLFDGFANSHNVEEQKARASEVQARLFSLTRDAEETVRSSWSRLSNQRRLVDELATQSRVTDDLLLSYREQFNVGRRSLLDVLDAQNTRYNVQAQLETARLAQLYAQYRVLASINQLIEALDLEMATEAWSNDRDEFSVDRIDENDRYETALEAPLMGPPAPDAD
ncbi:TolC family protein [Sphingomicrobium nitratireducens]|uniref:TolC family protein n=1 Tax=Sphingomicrobium nitratireducens TaxID=2964666 RepID=UPI00224019C5|nr:TolC family protein [Sphingomicrobium nitratireducens]